MDSQYSGDGHTDTFSAHASYITRARVLPAKYINFPVLVRTASNSQFWHFPVYNTARADDPEKRSCRERVQRLHPTFDKCIVLLQGDRARFCPRKKRGEYGWACMMVGSHGYTRTCSVHEGYFTRAGATYHQCSSRYYGRRGTASSVPVPCTTRCRRMTPKKGSVPRERATVKPYLRSTQKGLSPCLPPKIATTRGTLVTGTHAHVLRAWKVLYAYQGYLSSILQPLLRTVRCSHPVVRPILPDELNWRGWMA